MRRTIDFFFFSKNERTKGKKKKKSLTVTIRFGNSNNTAEPFPNAIPETGVSR